MSVLRVGDTVRIRPTVTCTPWKGELLGRVLLVDGDEAVAVVVEGDEVLGHSLDSVKDRLTRPELVVCGKCWWFMGHELVLEVK